MVAAAPMVAAAAAAAAAVAERTVVAVACLVARPGLRGRHAAFRARLWLARSPNLRSAHAVVMLWEELLAAEPAAQWSAVQWGAVQPSRAVS